MEAAAAVPQSEEDQRVLENYRKMFKGSANHTLDAKGRMVIPLAFRERLGETFSIVPSFDFKSISIYPDLLWARTRDRYKKLSRVNTKLKRYLEQVDALSFSDQECDGQGRVLLPAKIRACILGEEKDVEITGADDHVRVVSRSSAEEQFAAFLQELPDILTEIDSLEE